MRLAPPQHRAYTYRVTTPPAELPVTLAEFKSHAKIFNSLEDSLLTLYLQAATEYAEKLTRRDIITRTYSTFRDFFPISYQNEGYYSFGVVPSGPGVIAPGTNSNVGFEIRRSPLVSVESIEYIDTTGSTQTVTPSVYYSTLEEDYSEVLLVPGQNWPTDAINRLQAITISFICGLFGDAASVDGSWKTAIMEHATQLWANRGDCDSASCASMVPSASKAFYLQKRIENL